MAKAKKKSATRKRAKAKQTIRRRYEPRAGTHMSKKDAAVVGDALDELHGQYGHVTAAMVLEAARRKRSKLHKFFEWNDTAAARKYRKLQAGQLIRSVRVVIEGDNQPQKEMRAFVHVVREDDKVYIPAIEAMADDEYRQQLIDRAFHELQSWRARYDDMVEFAGVFSEIDAARAKIKKIA